MTIEGGYLIIARKLWESKIAAMPPHYREIWLWLLKEANHKTIKYNGQIIERGQCIRSYSDIIEGLSWFIGYRRQSYKKHHCEKAMMYLTKEGMIETAKTTKGVLITICNYDYYQDPRNYDSDSDSDNRDTMERQSSDTINKNENNILYISKRFNFEEWPEHVNTSFDLLLSDQKWIQKMIIRYQRVDILATIEEAREYWAGYEGYTTKKGSKNCNWKSTLQNAFKTTWLKVPKDIPQPIGRQSFKPSPDPHSNNGLHQQYQQARQIAYDNFKSSLDLDALRTKFRDEWLKKDPEYITLYPDWEKRLEPHFKYKLARYIESEVDFPTFDQWKARSP